MDSTLIAGIVVGATAATFLNVGKGIQKMKVEVLREGLRAFAREHRRDLGIWAAGFIMTTSASVLFSYAMKLTDKAGIVSATGGLGLVGLVLFASLVLKERFGWREFAGTSAIVLGTAMVGYFNKPFAPEGEYPLANMFVLVGVLAASSLACCVYSWKTRRLHSLAFGASTGLFIGFSMIIADLALIKSGNDFLGQLRNPFPYVAVCFGTVALILTQFAFLRGRAMVIVPTTNSFYIATPAVIEMIVLGTRLGAWQLVGLAAIVAGVVVLTTTSEGIRAV